MVRKNNFRRPRRTLPKAICERSGLEFPYHEMVTEPGTGLRVHYTESDGYYSEVCHPQNFVGRNSKAENVILRNPRPDRTEVTTGVYLVDNNGNQILTIGGSVRLPIYVYD